jgi:DNA repair exonuclease SbcCD ATPase subunit
MLHGNPRLRQHFLPHSNIDYRLVAKLLYSLRSLDMKLILFITAVCFFIASGAAAQEPDSAQITALEQELGTIRSQMDDLVRSEAALRDRQTTRMMRLEEDMESMRQEMGRKVSETEIMLSQELSLLREYIEIINKNIRELNTTLSGYEHNLEDLGESLISVEQNLTRIRTDQEQTDKRIAAADDNIATAEKKIAEISASISDLSARIENNFSRIEALETVENRIAELTGNISDIESKFDGLSSMVEQELEENISAVEELEKGIREEISDLSQKLAFTDQGVVERISQTESRIAHLNEHISEREIYAAGAILGLGLLLLMTAFLAVSSRKKVSTTDHRLKQNIAELSSKIEEQGAVLDARLVELLEKQVTLLSEAETHSAIADSGSPHQAADHTLAIVLGEEIYRIMLRNKETSEKSEAFEQMRTSLRRLWSALREKGYEVIDLQDQQYHEDMEARAEFFLTHELLPGEQIVSRVIKPLIKYQGVTIQEAEIEVMVGE